MRTAFAAVSSRRMIVAFAFGIGLTNLSSHAASSLKDKATPESSSDESIATSYEHWMLHHQQKHSESPISTQKRKFSSSFVRSIKAEEEREKRSAQADQKMAIAYSAWPILRVSTPATRSDAGHDEALLGSWWGIRPTLARYGIVLNVNYFGMAVGNVSGGMRKGADYAGQTSLGIDADWGLLAGLNGFSTHLFFLNRSGRPVGRDYVGDSVFNENNIYGAGGNVIAHLGYAFIEQKLWHDRLDLMAGRMGAAMLFNASPIFCDFFSFGLCPTPRAISGGSQDAFVMPPQNNWSLYASLSLDHDLYLRTGINAVGGALGGSSGFNWSSQGVTGVMLPFEAGWSPHWGKSQKPVHLRAGFYASTAQASDIALNRQGNLLALSGGAPLEHRGYFAAWAGGDIMLLRQTAAPDGGLLFFFNYTHSDDRLSIYRDMGVAGFEDRGFWTKRPQDRIGLLFVWSEQSAWLRKRLRAAHLSDVQNHTGVLEAQYGAHIAAGTFLTPDIQYVIRPGAAGAYHNAVVLGTSLQVGL